MSGNIPTATFVSESAVIEAPLAQVWHLIKLQDFSTFWSKLSTSEFVKDSSPEADVVRWTFTDKTVLDVKQEEHSVGFSSLCTSQHSAISSTNHVSQAIDHYITYSIISAEPSLTYTSVVSTVRCYPITSGKHAGHTYVTWTGNFSSDAGADVVQDGRYKRQEALADLAKKVAA